MELFRRNPFIRTETSRDGEPVFTPVEAADSEEQPRNLAMLISLAIAAFAFAVLLALFASWLYHKAHKPAPAPESSQNLPAIPQNP
jgi:DNA polymerase IIIc chi subunit